MTGSDRQAIIAEIAALTEPARLQADEVTKVMLAEAKGIPAHIAANQLNRQVLEETMTVRKVKIDGKWTNAYSIIARVTDLVTNGDDLEF